MARQLTEHERSLLEEDGQWKERLAEAQKMIEILGSEVGARNDAKMAEQVGGMMDLRPFLASDSSEARVLAERVAVTLAAAYESIEETGVLKRPPWLTAETPSGPREVLIGLERVSPPADPSREDRLDVDPARVDPPRSDPDAARERGPGRNR